MVRDDDAVAPDLGSANRLGRVQDALDDEGARKERPITFEIAPSLRRGGRPRLGIASVAGRS